MKALLLTPTYFPQLTGNAVTVDRISKHLAAAGIASLVVDLSQTDKEQVVRQTIRFQPDIIHTFHAYKSGRIARFVKVQTGTRFIVTMTGTDLNVDLKSARKKKAILEILHDADAVTVFNEAAEAILLEAGVLKDKVVIIHQSVSFPDAPYVDFRGLFDIDRDSIVFLVVGAVRRIKNIELAYHVLNDLKHRFPCIHLIIAGPIIEYETFKNLEAQIADKTWVTYAGAVAREDIRSLFLSSDVFLNTSFSESESNAMLEALSCRMIVVGRNISGNTSVLNDETGFLFSDKRDLRRKIIYIIQNFMKMNTMRQKAETSAALDFSQIREQRAYLNLYKIISKKA
ncbi:MAG: glycosyltransferase family 4 protein [Syntrophaceae bacterium]|nr:glycosyltransferase family 4 protein [Syntrophaceae bacterium]